MPAEALTSVLLEKLASGAIKQAGRVLGVRSDLQKLESALSAIQAVIPAAEERSVTEGDVRDWVAKLKDAAYDADDLLDEFQTYAEWRNQESSMSNKVRIFFSPRSNPLAFRIKMSFKIKVIKEKLDMIAQERSNYHLREAPPSHTLQHDTDTRMTAAVIDETNIIGRDDDVEELVRLLLEKEAENEDISVVTIVGIGGLGKTTLAQRVYNDESVVKQESFDLRIWVYVSDKFDVKRIATSIVEFATGGKCDLPELAPVVNRVQQILRGKRFLLVLDDIWNENEEEWEKLRGFLAVGAKGSKIVATARSDKVATIMGTTSLYYLRVLSEDNCWRLFQKRAFKTEDIQREPSLEAIGREIVAKCRGSPLAAKSMGSLMRFKRGREEWLAVRDSDVWRSTIEGNQVMASLKLSYNHLSPDLKQCFAYCCIFPKGTSIVRHDLILHWIALGFIPSNTSLQSAVNKGNEYFNNLVWISFLDEHSSIFIGEVSTKDDVLPFYKMHDLVHDLSNLVAGDENFICYADQKVAIPRRCRFCTLVGTLEESKLKDFFRESRKIRALHLEGLNINNSISISFTTLSRLRVLDMVGARLRSLPESLDRLQSLQILNLNCSTTLVSLPESIGKLANLRTLKLLYCRALHSLPQSLGNLSNLEELDIRLCSSIVELPEGMGNMVSLRHLKNGGMSLLRGMPLGIGKMRSLVTLQLFVVGEDINHSSIAEMQHLNLIEGDLELTHLENVKIPGDAARANMKEKHRLKRLYLIWSDLIPCDPYSIHEEVLAYLIPHPNLKKLEVERYPGINFPNWVRMMGVSLPNLLVLRLCSLKCRLLSFNEGLPPCLKKLYIVAIDTGRHLELSGGGSFPLLELQMLYLSDMPDLEGWLTVGDGVELYPRLVELKITNCPKLHAEPCIPATVKELDLYGDVNNELLISVGRAAKGVDLQDVSYAALEVLTITGNYKMIDLPEGIRRFTSVRTLYINSCPNVSRLPEWLRELTSLENLTIYRCGRLDERCKDTGEDWPIIAHIRNINVYGSR